MTEEKDQVIKVGMSICTGLGLVLDCFEDSYSCFSWKHMQTRDAIGHHPEHCYYTGFLQAQQQDHAWVELGVFVACMITLPLVMATFMTTTLGHHGA